MFDFSVSYLLAKGMQNIYLDGDLAAVPIYEKAGFRKIEKSLRFTGKVPGQIQKNIRNVTPEDIKTICEIDRELFGDDRGYFLKRRCFMFPGLCLVSENKDGIIGYIMARPGLDVISVGPWVMLESGENPGRLLTGLSFETGEKNLRIGVLESNKNAIKIIRSLHTFEEKEYCWRMVYGPNENLGRDEKLLAIGSAAKG